MCPKGLASPAQVVFSQRGLWAPLKTDWRGTTHLWAKGQNFCIHSDSHIHAEGQKHGSSLQQHEQESGLATDVGKMFNTFDCLHVALCTSFRSLDGDTVCPTMKNGQDDLPGFDLITQFQLDVIPMRSVRKVEGSTPLQVAYRLDREANFQIPTRLNFPRGFPDEYSFMTTFRMIKNTVNKVWNIWQVVEEDGLKQAGMRLNGDQQALEFFLTTMEGDVQTVTFPGLYDLFNTKWHKVMVGVEKELVTLYVDCHPVDQKPIKRKGYVNTEGDTLIGRLDSDPNTSVVFELQWMLIHCDPKRAHRESCNELPQSEMYANAEPDPKPIPGPPGPEGPEGPRGPHGEPGRDGRDASLSAH
ncbi:collagen alpha-1(IX) chain-like [Sinocyclocheilus grahami]|uniref:collagen alpha-1(IX) chain-like n=1 Tax=Sinocyclocheilus grahami TaxID=75366 RepID=UPI0007ACEE17|nr:PREDICTED: collagen alpha-1(IX) chain-like [Sinocyclocheilus grahami]